MDTVSPAVMHDLQARLQQQRRKLTATLRERLHRNYDQQHMALFSSDDAGAGAADGTRFSDIDIALLNHELGALRAVEDALARMHEGRYGICTCCGGELDAARLRAQPDAPTCPDCQAHPA
jgi:RNA polymerase-binding transcription factor DksA